MKGAHGVVDAWAPLPCRRSRRAVCPAACAAWRSGTPCWSKALTALARFAGPAAPTYHGIVRTDPLLME